MSIAGDIMKYLGTKSEAELRSTTSTDIGGALGRSGDQISKHLWSLEHTGRLRLIRGGNAVIGVDWLNPRQVAKRTRRTQETSKKKATATRTPLARSVRTPVLDSYAAAKVRAQQLREDASSRWVQVEFAEDPGLEEGLKLKESFARLDAAYAELAIQHKALVSEYQGWKAREEAKATAEAIEAIEAARPD